ncbi:MAG: acyl-CoA dehydrogenase family protein [Gammaproteobacteria bacterium]|nr:acyl-CoA dehydrogenase family protein [Gammaproteobacteria bacterium]
MGLVLNEEQRMLQRSAQEFFSARQPLKALRTLRDNQDATGFDRELWRAMAELGWAGILIPEAYGGAAFGYQGLGLILEEAGRSLAASPLISTALLGGPLILSAGSEAQKHAWLGAVAAGERVVALALDERSRHAPTSIATRAKSQGSGYVLKGSKVMVLDGHVADQLLVVARTSGADDAAQGLTIFVVDATARGITRTRLTLVDSRNAANVAFDNVEVAATAVLGMPDSGYAALAPVLDGARVGLAAEMLGSGLEAFERTLNYLKLRVQFGVPIGSFQALKHRAALMYCEIELTRSVVLEALTALDEQRGDVPQLASLAKAKACEMLELVSSEAIQLFGGIGMTDEEEIGFFIKRARVAQQTFGDAVFHRDRYATSMGF